VTDREKLRLQLLNEAREHERVGIDCKTPSRTPFDSDDFIFPDESDADLDIEHFLHPMVDGQITRPGSSLTGLSIREELADEYLTGKVRPFVEGEPIGTIPPDHRADLRPGYKSGRKRLDYARAYTRRTR
jgi:hypothetical protein